MRWQLSRAPSMGIRWTSSPFARRSSSVTTRPSQGSTTPRSCGNWSVCVSTLTLTTDLTLDMCTRWLGRCMSGPPAPECNTSSKPNVTCLTWVLSPKWYPEASTAKTRGLSWLPKVAAWPLSWKQPCYGQTPKSFLWTVADNLSWSISGGRGLAVTEAPCSNWNVNLCLAASDLSGPTMSGDLKGAGWLVWVSLCKWLAPVGLVLSTFPYNQSECFIYSCKGIQWK